MFSALDIGERSASRPGRFNPKKGDPSTHCIGGWLDPRAGLKAVETGKSLAPVWDRTLSPCSPSLLPSHYTVCAIGKKYQ
jgi:hypothetical protein